MTDYFTPNYLKEAENYLKWAGSTLMHHMLSKDDNVNMLDALELSREEIIDSLAKELELSTYEVMLYTRLYPIPPDRIWKVIAIALLKPIIDKHEFEEEKKQRKEKGPLCNIFSHTWKSSGIECKPGHVYIARCGDLHKIGYSCRGLKSVHYRINSLKREKGVIAKLHHAIQCACASGLEQYLHKTYVERKVSGEFFNLSKSDLNEIYKLDKFNEKPVTHIHA